MQDKNLAAPSGPPAFQGGDASGHARGTVSGGGGSTGTGTGTGSIAIISGGGAAGPLMMVSQLRPRHRHRHGGAAASPLRHLPARTWRTRLADAGSLMALCGLVCGGPLMAGMVWLPWAKHVISPKYIARFRDGLPHDTLRVPYPATETQDGNGVREYEESTFRLRKRNLFTPPAPAPGAAPQAYGVPPLGYGTEAVP